MAPGGGATCSGTSGGSPYSVAQDLTRAKGAPHAIYLRALPYVPRRKGSLECFAPRKSERAEAARTQGQPVSGNVGKFIVAGRAHGDSESARSSLTSGTPLASPWRRLPGTRCSKHPAGGSTSLATGLLESMRTATKRCERSGASGHCPLCRAKQADLATSAGFADRWLLPC